MLCENLKNVKECQESPDKTEDVDINKLIN